MNEFQNAKEEYDNTPIPAELSERVRAGIREGRARHRARRGRIIRRWGATAACFAVLLAGLNLSPTIAKAAAEVPVLGGLFQVLTFVDYDKTEDGPAPKYGLQKLISSDLLLPFKRPGL